MEARPAKEQRIWAGLTRLRPRKGQRVEVWDVLEDGELWPGGRGAIPKLREPERSTGTQWAWEGLLTGSGRKQGQINLL